MISRIDHISIAVKDYEKALHFFQHVLGAIPGVSGKDPTLKYLWQSFSMGDLSGLELLNATEEGSFLDNFLERRKTGGVHHITLQTPDIYEAKKSWKITKSPTSVLMKKMISGRNSLSILMMPLVFLFRLQSLTRTIGLMNLKSFPMGENGP